MTKLKDWLGHIDVVFILDSNCSSYDALGITVSLRGNMKFSLKASVLTEGVHSMISGVVPDSFWIVWNVLERLEDTKTGKLIEEF